MSKAGEKMIEGMKQALAFARDECDHHWIGWGGSTGILTKECLKCKVRVTEFPPRHESR